MRKVKGQLIMSFPEDKKGSDKNKNIISSEQHLKQTITKISVQRMFPKQIKNNTVNLRKD